MDKIVKFCLKSVAFIHFTMYFHQYQLAYVPFSISDNICENLDFQKIVYYCFKITKVTVHRLQEYRMD